MSETRTDFLTANYPIIHEKLPVANKGMDICIFTTIFYKDFYWNEFSSKKAEYYAKNITYAYRQLIRNTDILDTCKFLCFIDDACWETATPYFQKTGMMPMVRRLSDVSDGISYLNRVALLANENISNCRYMLSIDDDLWFAKPFSFKSFAEKCDTAETDIWIYEWETSSDTRERKYYTDDIDMANPLRHWVLNAFGKPYARGTNDLLPYGTFVMIESGKKPFVDFYRNHGALFQDDEPFYECMIEYQQMKTKDPEIPIILASLAYKTEHLDYSIINVGVEKDTVLPNIAEEIYAVFK